MKRVFLATLIALCLNLSATAQTWPPLTTVNWDGITNRPCYQGFVWCLMELGTDSTLFANLVHSRGHTLWRWHNFPPSPVHSAIVDIGPGADLALQATMYWNDPTILYASPMLYEVECHWPDDGVYLDREWVLQMTDRNRPSSRHRRCRR